MVLRLQEAGPPRPRRSGRRPSGRLLGSRGDRSREPTGARVGAGATGRRGRRGGGRRGQGSDRGSRPRPGERRRIAGVQDGVAERLRRGGHDDGEGPSVPQDDRREGGSAWDEIRHGREATRGGSCGRDPDAGGLRDDGGCRDGLGEIESESAAHHLVGGASERDGAAPQRPEGGEDLHVLEGLGGACGEDRFHDLQRKFPRAGEDVERTGRRRRLATEATGDGGGPGRSRLDDERVDHDASRSTKLRRHPTTAPSPFSAIT